MTSEKFNTDEPITPGPVSTPRSSSQPSPLAPLLRHQKIPPIVAVGASAGGVSALEHFFANVPLSSGLAYVVVQHLDPHRQSLLVDLVQKQTSLPVLQIEDRTQPAADHIYIAPPGYETSILNGVLHLLRPATSGAANLPIDFFFRALAVDQGPNSAAVILSGMGSDGTLGLRAMKEKMGGAFVQSPESADFDAMPRNAIAARLADVVASPAELPAKIASYFQHPLLFLATGNRQALERLESALEKVLILVRAQTGHDFSRYKKSPVYRRIQRRMAVHQLTDMQDYLLHVRNNPFEAELLFKELLIGVTCFFRDTKVWQRLQEKELPQLLSRYPEGGTLRAWVVACSTGEEAYTLAMIFLEAVEEHAARRQAAGLAPSAHYTLQIFASDLEIDAIDKARAGVYSENIKSDVSEARLARFFTRTALGYRINKDIRAMVVFAQQNIASDPPFSRLDLLSCRNLLIYLEPELQRQLLTRFFESMLPGGLLILGGAESIGPAGDLFTTVDARTRLFRRIDGPAHAVRGGLRGLPSGGNARLQSDPALLVGSPVAPAVAVQVLADQLVLRDYAPATALVNAQGDIVYFSGHTGRYLEPAAGQANLNLFAMVRPALRPRLSTVFSDVLHQRKNGAFDAVFTDENEQRHQVQIKVELLHQPAQLSGWLIVVFTDLPAPLARGRRRASARKGHSGSGMAGSLADDACMQQLAKGEASHQATREAMQTAQEELRSSNEELQWANEELSTSREEMQSINRELQTVNAELQTQIDALSRASDDMENLLNSSDIAALFLDRNLNVRRFTPRMQGIIHLIPGDTGRPVTDLVSDLDYDLARDAGEVLRTLLCKEREVTASNGRAFMVRTVPYRTQDNRIAGVVSTFNDITAARPAMSALHSPPSSP